MKESDVRRPQPTPPGLDAHEGGAPAYTVLWTGDYCRKLRKAGDTGKPLRVLFGGSHSSQPLLSRFGVSPGDWVYPIQVRSGRLLIIGRMRVDRFIDLPEYLVTVLKLPEAYSSLHTWDAEARLQAEHPEWGHLLPWGCLVEVALGVDGSPIRFDLPVPEAVVGDLRFTSRRGERGIKHVEAGLIKSSLSLQGGAYHLTDSSAKVFADLVATGEPSVRISSVDHAAEQGDEGRRSTSPWPPSLLR